MSDAISRDAVAVGFIIVVVEPVVVVCRPPCRFVRRPAVESPSDPGGVAAAAAGGRRRCRAARSDIQLLIFIRIICRNALPPTQTHTLLFNNNIPQPTAML